MSRHYPDFLSAYMEYASNQYAPAHFTQWTGISIIAAALERKVWIPEENYRNYPNLFVLLAAGPGVGKTSAIRQGLTLIRGLQLRNNYFKVIEGVSTSAGLREQMKALDTMPDNEPFSSIYMVGKEGSESALKNHGDDFRSAACAMYDCEEVYQFTLKDVQVTIPQPVMNMLVGTTFDFLGSVVDQNSVFGGLASRFTYILEKDNEMKGDFFSGVDVEGEEKKAAPKPRKDPKMKERLIDDLYAMHKMYGAYRVKRDVFPLVTEWFNSFKKEFNTSESDRLKAIMIRKRTLLKKLIIILAASSGPELLITADHAQKAIELVDEATKDNDYIMSQAIMSNVNTQGGLNELIIQTIRKNGGSIPMKRLRWAIFNNGNDTMRVESTLNLLLNSGMVKLNDDMVSINS